MSDGIAPTGFWLDSAEHVADETLKTGLALLFEGSSVVDFGCGDCYYLKQFRQWGIECDGYDGNPLTPAEGGVLDLSENVDLGKQYDWVLSLEVGEHIPVEYERRFIENVHAHNRLGVVLSWAIEGQGGRGHVNERNNDYVKRIFEELGYSNDREQESKLRRAATLDWFKNTIMVFRKKGDTQ